MVDIGRKLKDRREELGFTLEEMSVKTKISAAQLTALEQGNIEYFHDDMSYVKYYTRFYCQALYLDYNEIRDELSNEMDNYTQTLSIKAIREKEEIEENIAKRTNQKVKKAKARGMKQVKKIDYSLVSLIAVISVLAICLCVVFVTYVLPNMINKPKPTPTPPPVVVTPSPSPSISPELPEEGTPLEIVMKDARNYTLKGFKENEQLSIKVEFNADTWIKVFYDDVETNNPQSRIYNPGETMEVTTNGKTGLKITIHFGYLKSNVIYINGEVYELDASIKDATNSNKINFVLEGE